MSSIKVTNINNASAARGGIAFDADGHVTVDGLQLPSAGALSNRNLVINGGMQVSQRSTSTAVTTTGTYVLDRFTTGHGSGFNINSTVSQSSTTPAGFANSLKVDVTAVSTPSGSENGLILQRIEAQNLQHLQYGTSTAQTCTISFWVRSNKTGTYCFQILQDDAQKYVLYEYTISSADTWEKKTITIVGNTADTIANDNGLGFELRWHLASGSTDHTSASSTWTGNTAGYLTTSNQVNLFDSTSNEWYLTGVQLEVGSTATPYEHRAYSDELLRCQRYYWQVSGVGRLYCGQWNSNRSTAAFHHPCEMRATPTGNGTITGANRMTNAEANTKTHTTFYVDSNTSAYVDYATFDAEL